MSHESEQAQLLGDARLHLTRHSTGPRFTTQLPTIYLCDIEGGRKVRCTATPSISDQGAE